MRLRRAKVATRRAVLHFSIRNDACATIVEEGPGDTRRKKKGGEDENGKVEEDYKDVSGLLADVATMLDDAIPTPKDCKERVLGCFTGSYKAHKELLENKTNGAWNDLVESGRILRVVDKATELIQKAKEQTKRVKRPLKKPLSLQTDGDLWTSFWLGIKSRGHQSIKITKV